MHECLNFASVMQAAVLFVCGNNGLSTNTPLSVRQPKGHQIWKWAAGYGIPAVHVDGSDVFAVHQAAQQAVAHIRAGNGPYFIEAPYFRARSTSATRRTRTRTSRSARRRPSRPGWRSTR